MIIIINIPIEYSELLSIDDWHTKYHVTQFDSIYYLEEAYKII